MGKKSIGYIKDNKTILEVFAKRESDDTIHFYDSNNNLLAIFIRPDELTVAKEYRDRPPEFLNQINSLWKTIYENSVSLDELNKEKKEYIRELESTDNSIVASTSSIKLNQELDESKLHINDEKETKVHEDQNFQDSQSSKQLEHNKKALEASNIREETKLSTRVDDRYTLGDLLGIADQNASLVCVDSTSIAGNQSSSKFTFLIKHPDGSLEKADMFSQQDGLNPSREIYASNRDGSSVDRVQVRSMYRFVSPTGKEAMLSVSYGEAGTLKFHYGVIDRTNNNQCMAIPLETNTTRFVTKEVQDTLDPERGQYRSTNSLSEIAEHTKKGCDDLTIKEADGNENTGHHHLDNEQYMFIASNILEKNPELEDFYSVKGLADALKDYINRHHDKPIQEAISDFTEESLEDCEHFKSKNK